jgi:hypothetical protein
VTLCLRAPGIHGISSVHAVQAPVEFHVGTDFLYEFADRHTMQRKIHSKYFQRGIP